MRKYFFHETDSFKYDYGRLSKSCRDKLKYEIIWGKREIITGAGGLFEKRINEKGFAEKPNTKGMGKYKQWQPRWLIVYAVYKPYSFVVLLTKFSCRDNVRRKLSSKEQSMLARLKKKLDEIADGLF